MNRLSESAIRKFRMLAPVEFSPEKILLKEIRPENLTNLIKAAEVADSIFW